eukprot:TRINITY_DN94355_c0_g1_i1.p1 TRINITY_DN94355_c0_g1~~TRINITY_DN94355_c0_g1_i1.p1  ORF type:complete len:403 (+),score=105.68 TRINITY_DN94355_c0_g1_i1:102-1310(+)
MHFKEGEQVQYWSGTVSKWINAKVQSQNADGTWRLDRKPRASEEHIRRHPEKSSEGTVTEPSAQAQTEVEKDQESEAEEVAWDCRGVLKQYNSRREFGFISPLLSGLDEIGGEVEAPPEGLWFFRALGGVTDDHKDNDLKGSEVSFDVIAGSQGKYQAANVKILKTVDKTAGVTSSSTSNSALVQQRGKVFVGVVEKPADVEKGTAGIISCNRLQDAKATFEASEVPESTGAPKGAAVAFEVCGGLEKESLSGTVRAMRLQVLSLPAEASASSAAAPASQDSQSQDGSTSSCDSEDKVESAKSGSEKNRMDAKKRKSREPSEEDVDIFWKCFPCKAFLKGECSIKSTKCRYAHDLDEVRPLPECKAVQRVARRQMRDHPRQMHMPMQMGYGMMPPPGYWGSR